MIKFFYITNKPDVALIAEEAGVDRIFVDLEQIGKQERQGGMDSVQSKHSLNDVETMHYILSKAQLLVRSNPIHINSEVEIDAIVKNGADIIMLPFFKTVEEVRKFLCYVGGRAKTVLLIETKEAVEVIDDILALDGIDEMYIGLNDLHLSYGMTFMFQLLADGTVDRLVEKFKKRGVPYGFGGIARLGGGMLPAEHVMAEHYRLGSTRAILARAFCNSDKVIDEVELRETFNCGMQELRVLESTLSAQTADFFESNRKFVQKSVSDIVESIKNKQS